MQRTNISTCNSSKARKTAMVVIKKIIDRAQKCLDKDPQKQSVSTVMFYLFQTKAECLRIKENKEKPMHQEYMNDPTYQSLIVSLKNAVVKLEERKLYLQSLGKKNFYDSYTPEKYFASDVKKLIDLASLDISHVFPELG